MNISFQNVLLAHVKFFSVESKNRIHNVGL